MTQARWIWQRSTAQQTYLADADLLDEAQCEQALAAVALYRSLGGGWSRSGDVIATTDRSGPNSHGG
jgi:hypothetical protein